MAHNPKLEWPTAWVNENYMRPQRPRSAMQALMEAPPGHEPAESDEDENPLADLLHGALEQLPRDERLLVEAIVFERQSFRQLEYRYGIGKSILHRKFAAAILQLRAHLIEFPEIANYLEKSAPS